MGEMTKIYPSSSIHARGRGAVYCVLTFSAFFGQLAFAQSASPPVLSQSIGTAPSTAQIAVFKSVQQSLAASLQPLISQGATPAQLEAWQQQNATQLAAQRQQAQVVATSQPAQPIPIVTEVEVPEGASQTMEDFLTERAKLQNAKAQLFNQQLQSSSTVDKEQIEATFQSQNATAIAAQAQRATILSQEGSQQPLPVPPPLTVPAGASAQMKAFLTLRDQLMREHVSLWNQNLSATPAEREASLLQWQQQNASSIQQLQLLAQNLKP
jgi:hypothetical protein